MDPYYKNVRFGKYVINANANTTPTAKTFARVFMV